MHTVITPLIVAAPGSSRVIPLATEFIVPQDGHDKQDGETAAAKRWLAATGGRCRDQNATLLGINSRLSTFITSNRVITDWERYLGDAPLTTAILDRLMHRSTFLEFAGRSYRLKDAAHRLAKSAAGA